MTTPTINHDSSLGILNAGLAFRMILNIQDDGVARDMSAHTLTAQILSSDHTRAITAAVTQVNTSPANWSLGKLLVVIPSTETVKVQDAEADLVIYETDGANVWGHFFSLRCKPGVVA